MAVPWGSIKSLLLFFGPALLPKAISYYRNARNGPRAHGLKVRPVPPKVSRALVLLFVVACVFLVRTLPILAPENVFTLTQSRLQIPVDVLFTRLAALRPNGALTTTDAALRARFVNLESRLLYLQFGPEVLAGCPFCSADEPTSYLYYALPSLAIPHLVNLIIITIVTSHIFTGREGAGWRTIATIAAVSLATFDLYFVSAYNYQANSRALRLNELDFFFWTARLYRAIGLAALDGLLGWLMYLSSTNRAFASPPTAAERVELAVRALGGIKGKLNAAGVVKNTVIRDEELRTRGTAYWSHEVRLMRDVMEDREVIEGVNDALENRIDIQTITKDAEMYAQNVLQPGLAT
ncbi:hypothetical protein QBC34DRAFT_391379 [Podospora aff. communis PSN243]|uniref:Chorismate synthase protein n=1 Tax=Podospora aff. communis PSN243 TaxID=3040156 RepID=A0AAV9H524_9PEZI|nr:hypothetical protein QBC34DRAFT_391379 [Podospora aff. communis PSN243]